MQSFGLFIFLATDYWILLIFLLIATCTLSIYLVVVIWTLDIRFYRFFRHRITFYLGIFMRRAFLIVPRLCLIIIVSMDISIIIHFFFFFLVRLFATFMNLSLSISLCFMFQCRYLQLLKVVLTILESAHRRWLFHFLLKM